jgi:hypothetical protein
MHSDSERAPFYPKYSSAENVLVTLAALIAGFIAYRVPRQWRGRIISTGAAIVGMFAGSSTAIWLLAELRSHDPNPERRRLEPLPSTPYRQHADSWGPSWSKPARRR